LVPPKRVTYDFLRFENGAVPPELEVHKGDVLRHYGPQLGLESTEKFASGASPPSREEAEEGPEDATESANADVFPADPPKLRWNAKDSKLTVGSCEWTIFSRAAHKQEELFNAFEDAGWPVWVPNPFPSYDMLKDTVRSFNKTDNAKTGPILFGS
jgi:hypothetical protein